VSSTFGGWRQIEMDDKIIENLAELCKVHKSAITELVPDLEKIIEYFDQIKNYQTESDISVPLSASPVKSEMREDIPSRFSETQKILDAGPDAEYGFFRTPTIIEK